MEALCLDGSDLDPEPEPRSYIATLQLALQRSGDKKRPKHGADGGGHARIIRFWQHRRPATAGTRLFRLFSSTAASGVSET